MEDWQKRHINLNLVALIKSISINEELMGYLKENKLLEPNDIEILENPKFSSYKKSKKLFDILPTKLRAYEVLIEALEKTKQRNVLKILLTTSSLYSNFGLVSYDKNHVLGSGPTQAKVFKGTYGSRDCAVKVLFADELEIKTLQSNFNQLKNLDYHNNLLRYFTVEANTNVCCIAMELCVINLEDEIRIDLLNIPSGTILRECAAGVSFLHFQNIAHKNLKPTNILLNANRQVKIADFTTLTENLEEQSTSVFVENKQYMATELMQSSSEDIRVLQTPAADIFSLGCIFYFVLTKGSHPFGDDPIDIAYNIKQYNPKLGTALENSDWLHLIKQMISFSPKHRPSADSILESDQMNSIDFSDNELSDVQQRKLSKDLDNLNIRQVSVRNLSDVPKRIQYEAKKDNIIGKGSGGTVVYRGTFGEVPVAVKVLNEFLDEEIVMNEIRLLIKCKTHPNVVGYYCEEERFGGGRLLALELCDTTLQKWMESTRDKVSETFSAKKVLADVTRGLAYLHDLSIIHLDIKPSNILLTKHYDNTFVAKLADFGICREVECGRNDKTATSGHGSIGWRAPEIIQKSKSSSYGGQEKEKITMSVETDVFPLGCIFVYVLSNGKMHPFNWNEDNILRGTYSEWEHLMEVFDIQVNYRLFLQMLAMNKNDRPTTSDILNHPIFWDDKKYLSFLEDILTVATSNNEVLRKKLSKNGTPLNEDILPLLIFSLSSIQIGYGFEICKGRKDGWLSDVLVGTKDPWLRKFVTHNVKRENYNSAIGLINTIVNAKTFKPRLRSDIEITEFVAFWKQMFPDLIEHTRSAFAPFKNYPLLRSYYEQNVNHRRRRLRIRKK